MRCNARSQAYALDWPRWKWETVHVATPMSSTIGTTTIPHAFSHCAKVRSSAMIIRWISSFVFGIFSTTRTVITEEVAEQQGRRVDYSIALVECLSAFFIM